MNPSLEKFALITVTFLIFISEHQKFQVSAAGCVDDQSCTHLCGFAGAGQCVDEKYCKCANCPGRSIYELATLPKICTYDPTCWCPSPVRLSLTNGRVYFGHRCVYGTSLVCICFCMPTTPEAVLNLVKCPFYNSTDTTTTSTTPTSASTDVVDV